MLRNFVKIAIRNLKKHPGYSLINIFGLALGIGVSALILLFVQYELSYDAYHENSDRIVRVSRQWSNADGETSLHLGHVAPPFGPYLKEDFGGIIEEQVRLMEESPLVTYGDRSFVEERFFFADPSVFSIFTWEMISGDPATALSAPDGVVLTESASAKYFGDADPMGEILSMEFDGTPAQFRVTGVLKDIPSNSHFQLDFLASMEPLVAFYGGIDPMMRNFGSNNFATYLLLNDPQASEGLQAQLPAFIDRHMGQNQQGMPASAGTQLNLWPLTSIHLHSQLDSEIEANGNIEYVYIYTAIALFVLLIACINFMNLSTARSSKRATEIGLRKVIGADRRSLIRQFMSESIVMAMIALVAAAGLVALAVPAFNDFLGIDLDFNLFRHGWQLAGLIGVGLVVGLIAGCYPALFLSGFQPARVLKGVNRSGGVHQRFRSVLVVTQFSISIALVACMIVVFNQLGFMRSKDLGFDRDNLVILPASDAIISNFTTVRERLLSNPGIVDVSEASRVPSGRLLDSQGTQAEVNGELTPINTRIADIHVSHEFMKTFGVRLVAGRDFDINLASDSMEAFILNESAVAAIGWSDPESAIGKEFRYGSRSGTVIGVTQNFNFESLHQSIAPIVFIIPQSRIRAVAVRIRGDMRAETLDFLEEQWTSLRPGYPFEYYFVDDRFNDQYASEERLGQIFGLFSLLAVIIAALGLLGLASFTGQQRAKEIGIRKVLGARVSQIVAMLSREFSILVLIAFVVATPVTWFAMHEWLNRFAYRVDISILSFFLAGGLALVVALGTISYQSIKAGLVDPVKSLRSE